MVSENAALPDNWQMGQQVTANAPNYNFTWPSSAIPQAAWAGDSKAWSLDGFDTVLLKSNNCSTTGKLCAGRCAINCTNDMELYSFHTGGDNSVFGDGSVRFLTNDTSLLVLAAVITHSGGEVVNLDF
jgi:hypothetical protein